VVDYFENMRIENGFDCDTVYFEHLEGCWGNFFESGLAKAVELDFACKGIVSKTEDGVHAGSTFACYDEDADEDIDLILGDLAFGNLNRLLNGGDKTIANIVEQDTAFPAYDITYEEDIFPAPFLIDIDNDHKKDLLVSPNKQNISENFKNVAFYKNVSADDTYTFAFQEDSLFVSDMVDVGEGSRPVFFDHNNDGLMDIFIGNNGYYNSGDFITALALYENTGTESDPEFTLITRDYAGLSLYGFGNIAPAFTDLDGDGDEDMLVGTNEGHVQFFMNTASAGSSASFPSLTIANYQGIDPGISTTPQFVDVNEDGLVDLITGEQNGNLNYYENTGSAAAPLFSLMDELWGGVDVRIVGSTTGHSVPFLTKNNAGGWELYVGSESGTIFLYTPPSDFSGTFPKITSTFSNIDEGSFSSAQFFDITGDDTAELLTGNYRGGISLYRAEGTFVAIENFTTSVQIDIYPNPVINEISFSIYPPNVFRAIKIFDITGKQIKEHTLDTERTIDVSYLHTGIYILQFTSDTGFSVIKKMVKL
ncbi:MAG: T9SS type A sorting domain-containing protein, partial [Chitinophagales bacterium]|nr:T9SS type A sorting domain-containing protein [Chitinophagales bacterium]